MGTDPLSSHYIYADGHDPVNEVWQSHFTSPSINEYGGLISGHVIMSLEHVILGMALCFHENTEIAMKAVTSLEDQPMKLLPVPAPERTWYSVHQEPLEPAGFVTRKI